MTQEQETAGGPTDSLISRRVPIGNITVKEQHRRHFDEKKLKELALNIAKVDVLQPLLVRTMGTGKPFELVAGERRLRAAALAGLKDVPCRIGAWTDDEASEIQALENLHRQDLTPVEEARAFKALQDTKKYDVQALAQRIDKSVSYVHRALALLQLPPKMLQAIEEKVVSPAHGHVILRAPAQLRQKLVDMLLNHVKRDGPITAARFDTDVENQYGRDLDKAMFPKHVEFAGKPACAGCPFNSANQGDLFDNPGKGCCTNAPCFDAKVEGHVQVLQERGKEEFKDFKFAGVFDSEDQLTGSYQGKFKNGDVVDTALLKTPKMKAVIEKDPENFVWAFIKPKNNWDGKPRAVLVAKVAAGEAKQAPNAMTPQEKTARKKQIRQNFIDRAVSEALTKAGLATCDKFTKIHLAVICAHMPYLNKATREGLEKAMVLPQTELKALLKADEKTLRQRAFGQAMYAWTGPDEDVLELVGVDVKKITAEVGKRTADIYDGKLKGMSGAKGKEKKVAGLK